MPFSGLFLHHILLSPFCSPTTLYPFPYCLISNPEGPGLWEKLVPNEQGTGPWGPEDHWHLKSRKV